MEPLIAGMALSTTEVPIKINLIAPPLYVMTASTPERQDGLQLLTEGCRVVEEKIKAAGGNFTMQMAPKVVAATDEEELAARIKKADEENQEVDGDDDDEEEIGMDGDDDDDDDEDEEDEEGDKKDDKEDEE